MSDFVGFSRLIIKLCYKPVTDFRFGKRLQQRRVVY
jgi:hypothetical protein